MIQKLSSLRESVPSELIGKNIEYRILAEISNPKYPRAGEVKYSDDYLDFLNEQYPIDFVLGDKIEQIKNKKVPLGRVYQKNMDGAQVLLSIMEQSIQSEGWHPVIIDYDFYEGFGNAENQLRFAMEKELSQRTFWWNGPLLFGIETLRRYQGFVQPTIYENKIIAIPTQRVIEYISQQKESF